MHVSILVERNEYSLPIWEMPNTHKKKYVLDLDPLEKYATT